MMKRNNRMLIIFCVIVLCTQLFAVVASAHPVGVLCKPGSEALGWKVDCLNHQATPNVKWKSSISTSTSGVDYPYRQAMNLAAARWAGTIAITESNVDPSAGIISTYSNKNTSVMGVFYEYESDSRNHLVTWKIKFNKMTMDSLTTAEKATVAAHELGHAIGLNDLGHFYNQDKLMYSYWPQVATSPTAADKEGAKEATRH